MRPTVIPVRKHQLVYDHTGRNFVAPVRVSIELMHATEEEPVEMAGCDYWMQECPDGAYELCGRKR
jgi:hypothetical protein